MTAKLWIIWHSRNIPSICLLVIFTELFSIATEKTHFFYFYKSLVVMTMFYLCILGWSHNMEKQILGRLLIETFFFFFFFPGKFAKFAYFTGAATVFRFLESIFDYFLPLFCKLCILYRGSKDPSKTRFLLASDAPILF